mmetsp:Transcript_45294/g.105755  ORF Transcript_45294/g.105755 Transcript_45294/m.105755 type:complete len:528 (+) Transcript_45294:40-1623(+)
MQLLGQRDQSREVVVLSGGRQVDLQDLSHLRNLPEQRRESKIQEIQTGAQLLQASGIFPKRRPCQDVVWAILFLVAAAATFAFAIFYFQDVDTSLNEDSSFKGGETENHRDVEKLYVNVGCLTLAGVVGASGALVAAFFFMMMARACAKPVVYAALYFVPTLMILAGVGLVGFSATRLSDEKQDSTLGLLIPGAVLAALGLCYASLVWCCWSRFIPFTIEVVEMVAEISNDNPCMVAVSMLGSFLGGLWMVLVTLCYTGVSVKHQEDKADHNTKMMGPVDVAFAALLFWGAGVIRNVCHVSYCGVFGRWYFAEEGWPLLQSLRVALTTSFGSICLGSFLIALIRAVEVAVRSARNEAASEGNVVGCILLCLLDSIIACIGDIMEYFNDWAYVQCAIRGTSFCQSVRATYTLLVCNGVQYVITDILVDSVATLGAFVSALVGAALGGAVGALGEAGETGSPGVIGAVGALMGFVAGLIGGSCVMSIFTSGTKALLVCWAEDPAPLQEEYGDMHEAISNKIRAVEADSR